MKQKKRQRRRILLLADFAYASGKAVASGVIRFVSVHPGIDLLVHGRTSEMPMMREGLIPHSGIDGIVTCFGVDMDFMRNLLESIPHVPVVFASVARGVAPLEGRRSAAIFCGHAAVADAAAGLLVRHGLVEFGYVGSRNALAAKSWDAERGEAFRAALAQRGFHAETYSPKGGLDADAELASLSAWLRALPKPCGLFVSDDLRAMHVLNACRGAGIAVPEQSQVIGADNEEWICEHTSPTLTSVEPDFEGCGQRAAATLLAMMEGRRFEREAVFGAKNVEQRMSTTDMHGSVNRAVRARKWLRANFCEPFDVPQVAAHLGCSPRMLQLSYKAVFGRTIRDDIVEMRLERAKKLLVDTDMPVLHIPERCGSDAPNHFLRLFKERTGMTMLQWRRKRS